MVVSRCVRDRGGMLAEALTALASLAGNAVVAAATTDAWEAARRGFARLLGRGDPKQEQLAAGRLEETHKQLVGAAGADLDQARAAQAQRWAGRLADLLEETSAGCGAAACPGGGDPGGAARWDGVGN